MASIIEFNGVTKRYGSTSVFDALELGIEEHAIAAVVGKSGCGKSTLLQMVNGLIVPDEGTVRVFGEPIARNELTRLRRRIGYAVQGIGLFPHMRTERNIGLLGELEGWPRDRLASRVEELMSLMGLEPPLKERFPHELSGGEQQRVGICRAMLLAPEILLLDEPFSGIDPVSRQEIHARLLELLGRQPTTVLMVTHDMEEAARLATHLVVLAEHGIVQSGTAREVGDHPANAYVADLFSRPQAS
jgi:osmoprotectant transport system ATP-binding protein